MQINHPEEKSDLSALRFSYDTYEGTKIILVARFLTQQPRHQHEKLPLSVLSQVLF
jgi:hypothetical protein